MVQAHTSAKQSIKRVLLKFGLKQGDGEDLDSQLQELVKGYLQSKASGKRSRQRTAGPIEIYQEMPVDVFPPKVRTFIETVSDAIGCNPAFPAMPLLSALASCIGNSRRVRLKSSWAEPATVWALIIAESGQHKSPAMKHVLWPLHEWQDQAFRQYAADQAAYEEELEAYQEASKGRKNNGPKPPKPTPPVLRRYFVGDTTMEALIAILDSHWRGLLAAIDEGTLWFGSFGQYKGGRGGDVGHWLSMADAGPLTVDRKAGVKKSYFIRRANVSIATGTQPETLARGFFRQHPQWPTSAIPSRHATDAETGLDGEGSAGTRQNDSQQGVRQLLAYRARH